MIASNDLLLNCLNPNLLNSGPFSSMLAVETIVANVPTVNVLLNYLTVAAWPD